MLTDLEIFGEYLYDININGNRYSLYQMDGNTYGVSNGDFINAIKM